MTPTSQVKKTCSSTSKVRSRNAAHTPDRSKYCKKAMPYSYPIYHRFVSKLPIGA